MPRVTEQVCGKESEPRAAFNQDSSVRDLFCAKHPERLARQSVHWTTEAINLTSLGARRLNDKFQFDDFGD